MPRSTNTPGVYQSLTTRLATDKRRILRSCADRSRLNRRLRVRSRCPRVRTKAHGPGRVTSTGTWSPPKPPSTNTGGSWLCRHPRLCGPPALLLVGAARAPPRQLAPICRALFRCRWRRLPYHVWTSAPRTTTDVVAQRRLRCHPGILRAASAVARRGGLPAGARPPCPSGRHIRTPAPLSQNPPHLSRISASSPSGRAASAYPEGVNSQIGSPSRTRIVADSPSLRTRVRRPA